MTIMIINQSLIQLINQCVVFKHSFQKRRCWCW